MGRMSGIFLFFGIECIGDVVPIEGLSGGDSWWGLDSSVVRCRWLDGQSRHQRFFRPSAQSSTPSIAGEENLRTVILEPDSKPILSSTVHFIILIIVLPRIFLGPLALAILLNTLTLLHATFALQSAARLVMTGHRRGAEGMLAAEPLRDLAALFRTCSVHRPTGPL
jgi:hypothetical protein